MKTYLLINHSEIRAFHTQAAAGDCQRDLLTHTPGDKDNVVESFLTLTRLHELADDLTGKELVDIWSKLPGVKPVSKFENRATAAKRIWDVIQTIEGEGTPGAAKRFNQPSDWATPGPLPTLEQFDEAGLIGAPREAVAGTIEKVEGGFQITQTVDPLTGKPYTEEEEEYMKKAKVAKLAAKKAHAAAKARVKATPAKPDAAKAKTNGALGGTKQAEVIALLQRKNGATITEIMSKMGWLRHTVRGFMAGAMKKAGYNVESFKPEGGERTYRLPA